MQRRNGINEERGVVIVGAFAQPRRPIPVLIGRPSALIVSLAAYRVARSLRKGHVWLQLGEAGSDRD
jgi:hypothetical protein